MKRTTKRPKPLSKQAQNFILRNYKTMLLTDICKRLNRSMSTVYSWLRRRGLITPETADYSQPPYSTILKMYIDGWFIEDIMEATGQTENVCRSVIFRVFRTNTVPTRAKSLIEEPDSYIVKEREVVEQ